MSILLHDKQGSSMPGVEAWYLRRDSQLGCVITTHTLKLKYRFLIKKDSAEIAHLDDFCHGCQ